PALTRIPTGVVVGPRLLPEDHPVDLQGADALLRHEHQVADLEPESQRDLRVLKDGPGDDREAIAVPAPALRILAEPVEGPGLECVDLLLGPATGAADAVRPPALHQIVLAGVVGRKLPV